MARCGRDGGGATVLGVSCGTDFLTPSSVFSHSLVRYRKGTFFLTVVAGVLLLLLAGACSAGSTTSPRSTETTFGPDQVRHARLHVAYPFDLYTHCGVLDATFGGHDWVVVPPVVPAPRPQTSFNGVTTHGTMTLTSKNVALFRTAEGLAARFRPRRRGEAMPSAQCI